MGDYDFEDEESFTGIYDLRDDQPNSIQVKTPSDYAISQ